MIARALILSLALAGTATAAPQDNSDKRRDSKSLERTHEDARKDAVEAAWAKAPVEERTVTTDHSVSVDGHRLAYQATAGTLTIRDTEGKPTASMFYTAYTLDGEEPGTKRPVTFFYNGGPGSPTFWLRMGSFGPMRLQTGNPEFIRPAPYKFGPNSQTLLDKSDLVFLDAIGAGYSRPLGDAEPEDFYGVDQDVDAFASAIQRYVNKFGRWNSPKFLFGESYGTTRSGALAYELQERGLALNGVVLLSSIMNYGYRQPGLDQVYINYLPSYATSAWYHHKLANPPADVAAIAERAREFAVGPYASALAKGQRISNEERDRVAQQMSALTGLPVDFLIRANLRVDLPQFQKQLLIDQRRTIGRFDSRYTGIDADPVSDSPQSDASSDAISGAFIATFHNYLANTLGYRTDLPYRLSARDADGWTWDWHHEAPGSNWPQNNPNTAVDLAAAMRTNPYLKVLSMNGYYDMATPFFGTEFDLEHMMLDPSQQQNLSFRYYPSGHMAYLNPDALVQMKADLSRWYDVAVAEANRDTPPQSPSLSRGSVDAETPGAN